MASRIFRANPTRVQSLLSRLDNIKQAYIPPRSTSIRWAHDLQEKKEQPIKFTTSEAHVKYKATLNFYGDDRDLPPSHNIMLATTLVSAIFYLIYLRDDIDGDGGKNLIVPLHETVPSIAIPLLQSAIAENRKFGLDTSKLEKKLAEYMKEPEKYGGGGPRRLKEN